MNRRKRSRSVRSKKGLIERQLDIQLVKSRFFCDIDLKANDIEYAGSLTYFFVVLYAWFTDAVSKELGLILLFSAILIILSVRIKRQQIRNDAEKKFEEMSKNASE